MAFYFPDQLERFPWIVCDRSSLRIDDLADAFLTAAAVIAELAGEPINSDGIPEAISLEASSRLQYLADYCNRPMMPDTLEGDWELLDEVTNWLSDHAPYGFWFGSHDGDGCLFGFWPGDELTEELANAGVSTDDSAVAAVAFWGLSYPHGLQSAQLAAELADNPYVFPGGYPRYAVMSDGGALCHHCCHSERESIAACTDQDGWRVIGTEVNWEDTDLACCHCGNKIEAAYQ